MPTLPLARTTRWTSIRARIASPGLDRAIAARGVVWHEPLEAARAAQLLSARSRRQVADGLERTLGRAARGADRSAAAPLAEPAVRAAAVRIRLLAAALRASAPVDPAGVARARVLLVDPGSVLHVPAAGDAVGRRIEEAQAVLAPTAAQAPVRTVGKLRARM